MKLYDKQNVISFSLMGPESGGPCLVDSLDGKMIRVRPYRYDPELKKTHNPWTIFAHGSQFSAPDKVTISPFGLGYKTRVYSKNRVTYPMKRVDWDPDGERNPQNRGVSKFVRISWDEAARLVARELRRVKREYGMEAVLCESDMHGEGKHVAPSHGCPNRLLSILGGYTLQMRNMDSWEGWFWGAKHVWGCEPVGEMMPMTNLYPDIAENTNTLFYWGCDPETTPLGVVGQITSRLCYWMSSIGKRSIFICPDFNYGAAVHADKWIPVLPNTDAALQLAIAYTWITEDTYDKEYIASHSYGFDKFEDYVLGKTDGQPKNPAWASEKCGVSEWTIKALARHWAKNTASILHANGGGLIRGPYATEPARLEVMLLGMQGLGKPGVHQAKVIEFNLWNTDFPLPYQGEFMPALPAIADPLRPVEGDVEPHINMKRFTLSPIQQERAPELIELFKQHPAPKQFIPRCLVHEAILEGHAEWYGLQCFSSSQIPKEKNYRAPTQQYEFEKIQYPRPGLSKIHMMWTDAPCQTTCWNDGNKSIRAFRDESIEFIVAQHPWMENDCYFADIVLPVLTKHEMNDIANDLSSGAYVSIYKEEPCCSPIGESLSDFDVCARIAREFGDEVFDAYTGNLSEEERVRLFYKASGCEDYMTWAEFCKKKIYVVPCKENAQELPPGMREFFEDPEGHPLTTPTGLLEYSSTAIEELMPDDPERPPVASWIEKGPAHDERISSVRAEKYPLLCMSNHGRWRMHAQCDDIVWNREVDTMKVLAADGYRYEPCWLSTDEAKSRGISHGDIVKVHNERGAVLCGAYVTERLMSGVCYIDHGSRLDPIIPGVLDRGGAINTITPAETTGKTSTGMATSGFLAEVTRVDKAEMDAYRRDYPEAFERAYDNDCGVCLDGWLIQA